MKRAIRQLKDWRHAKRRRTRVLLIAIPLVLLVAYLGAREVAARSADQLTVTITQMNPQHSIVIYHQVFGAAMAKEAAHLLNDEAHAYLELPGTGVPASLYYGPAWHYHLAFSWHGILIETADMTENGKEETFTLTALGMPDVRVRRIGPGTWDVIVKRLAQASGGVIPISPYWISYPDYQTGAYGTPSPYYTPLSSQTPPLQP